MVGKSVSLRGVLCFAVSATLLLSTPIMAASSSDPSDPPPSLEGILTIANGDNPGATGYLEVSPDDYGSWASVTFGGGGDFYKPPSLDGMEVAFTSGLLLFVPASNQRELLSDNDSWQGVFDADDSLDRTVTMPLVASDTDGDSVDDQLESSFAVFGGQTSLSIDLTQKVSKEVPVGILQQDYAITNDGNVSVDLVLVRVMDADLLWSGDFADDEVGTNMHGADFGPFVFQQEANQPATTAVTISGAGNNYFGGKHGVQPENGPPPYDFGTDTEVWDAFGIPGSWESHIAGVGYSTNGVSGTNPPGSTSPEDGFIGLDFQVTLGPGESTTVTVFHTYGNNEPSGDVEPEPPVPATSYPGAIGLGVLLLAASTTILMWRRRHKA